MRASNGSFLPAPTRWQSSPYITLQDMKLDLVGVVDPERIGETFFGRQIIPLTGCKAWNMTASSSLRILYVIHCTVALLDHGIVEKNIRDDLRDPALEIRKHLPTG